MSKKRTPAPAKPADDLGTFGAREVRTVPFTLEEVRDSGGGKDQFTIRGHAAVFDKWSLDLGGFRERIAVGAFDDVLSRDPHVLHTWDHDTAKTLSSTRSKSLELRIDPGGLHMWSRVAPTSYAADLRILMERGDVDQASFAFTVAEDEWVIREENGEEVVERTILRVGDLFDVCTCAQGAYPTTDSQVVKQRALAYARAAEKLPAQQPADPDRDVAPPAGDAGPGSSQADLGETEDDDRARATPAAGRRADLLVLKRSVKDGISAAREHQRQIDQEIDK